MGEEGFRQRLDRCSTTATSRRRWSSTASGRSATWRTTAEPPAAPAPPQAARPLRREGGQRTPTSSPDAGWCSATATCASRTPWRRAQPLVPQRHRRRVRLRRAGPGPGRDRLRRVRGRPRATTSSSRGPRRTAGSRSGRRKDPLRTYCIEANSHIAPPKRYLSKYGQLLEHAPYCERDLRAAAGPAARRGRRRDAPATRPRSTSSTAATARGGDRRHGAHAARSTRSTSSAGTAASTRTCSTCATSSRSPAASTSRRRCTRCSRAGTSSSATSCRARSTTTRCRSRCPTTTPTSTATRSCSTSTATTRPARAPASARARSRCTRAVTPHGPQPGADGGLDRQALLRRARRHGRHVPPARARRGRPRGRRRQVRRQLAPRLRHPPGRRTPVARLSATRKAAAMVPTWWRAHMDGLPYSGNCARLVAIRVYAPPNQLNCFEEAQGRRWARTRTPVDTRSGRGIVSRHDRRMSPFDAFDPTRPFTRAEGIAAGLTPWQLRGPEYAHPFHDTYLARTAPRTLATRARAAVLGAPDTAVISHDTAAVLWGGAVPESSWIHVTVPPGESFVRTGVRTHRLSGHRLVAQHDGLRLTTPEQTFIDLAGRLDLVAAGGARRPARQAEGGIARVLVRSDGRMESAVTALRPAERRPMFAPASTRRPRAGSGCWSSWPVFPSPP